MKAKKLTPKEAQQKIKGFTITADMSGAGRVHLPTVVDVHADGSPVFASPVVHALVDGERRYRDSKVSQATADIVGMVGVDLPPDVVEQLRQRVEKLAGDVHAFTRLQWGMIATEEHAAARKKVDPADVVRRVEAYKAKGVLQADSFFEVADDLGIAESTVRNHYQDHKPRKSK